MDVDEVFRRFAELFPMYSDARYTDLVDGTIAIVLPGQTNDNYAFTYVDDEHWLLETLAQYKKIR